MTTNTLNSTAVFKTAFRELMKGVATGIPGYIIAFDPKTQRAQVQIGVQRVDVNDAAFDPPPIIDVPVAFAGDDYVLEYEIKEGCEGLVHFSQRCVDGWKNTGGIAANPLGRFHSLQDAFFMPGYRSLGNVIPNFGNDGIRIRDELANRYVWIKNDGTTVVRNGNAVTTYGADNSVTTTNGAGSIILLANGNISLNGVTITPDGRLITPPGGGITGSTGIPYESHRHNETGTITGVPIT